MFNDNNFWQHIQIGQLTERIERRTHPTRPEAKQPHCTETQTVLYLDATQSEVARVHQYRRPDGTLGGHGYPDPKFIILNGVKYAPALPPENAVGRIVFRCWEWILEIRYKLLA